MSPGPGHSPGTCRALLAELFDYLDGELSPVRCDALERHLAQCPCCGDMADNLRKAIVVCRAEGRRELPLGVRRRARQRVASLLKDGLTPAGKGRPRRPRA